MQVLKLFVATFITANIVLVGSLAPHAAAQTDVFEQACVTGNAGQSTVCQDSVEPQDSSDNRIYGPNGVITQIANIVAIIAGIAATIIIIVAGIQFMLATGDPAKVNNARNAIIYAVIGLVVVVLARALVLFVVGRL